MFKFSYLSERFECSVDTGEPVVTPKDHPFHAGAQAAAEEAWDSLAGEYYPSPERHEYELSLLLVGDYQFVDPEYPIPLGAKA